MNNFIVNLLSGFESPRFMVIIGRFNDFNEEQKAHLRSYNREWKNLELLTYDDVLARFQATIISLQSRRLGRAAVKPNNSFHKAYKAPAGFAYARAISLSLRNCRTPPQFHQ